MISPEERRERLEDAMLVKRLSQLDIREVDPLKNDRNAIEFYVMVMALLAGVRLFIDAPDLDVATYWRVMWRLLLIGGSSGVLIGLLWTGRSFTSHIIQQIGFIALGFGAMAYGTASQDWTTFAFGVAALIRTIQIDRRISEIAPGDNLYHFAPFPWSRKERGSSG